MIFLKEDGSLDIERMNALPIEEYMKMIGELTDEQCNQYASTFPENDGRQHTKAIIGDYTLEDEIKKGGVILKDYLNEKRKNIDFKNRQVIYLKKKSDNPHIVNTLTKH